MEYFSNQDQTEPVITVEQVDEIRPDEVKLQTTVTSEKQIQKELIKKIIIFFVIAVVVLGPLLFFIFRPKDYIIYEKYETFSPCTSDKNLCYQRTSLHGSGALILEGKINKKTKVSRATLAKVKTTIRESGLLSANCASTPILMGDKLSHTFIIDGQEKVIKSPGCDSEMDIINTTLDPILK